MCECEREYSEDNKKKKEISFKGEGKVRKGNKARGTRERDAEREERKERE